MKVRTPYTTGLEVPGEVDLHGGSNMSVSLDSFFNLVGSHPVIYIHSYSCLSVFLKPYTSQSEHLLY